MDVGFLLLLVNLVPLLVAFVLRKRILRVLGRYLIEGLLHAIGAPLEPLWVEEVSKAEDGSETRARAVSGPWRAYLGALAAVIFAEAMKKVKLKLPTGGGLPEGFDMSKIGEALPQLIMAMPGRNLNLGGFKLPKEVAAALSSLFGPALQGLVGGKKATAKGGTALTPEAQKIVDEAMK